MDKDRVEGAVKKGVGTVEKTVGDVTGDTGLQGGGAFNQAAGAAQAALGKTKDVAREYLDQASDYVGDARGTAERAVAKGRRYVSESLDGMPDADEVWDRGRAVVGRPVQDNPLTALLIAGAVGYGLALLIHGRSQEAPTPARRARSR